MKINIETYFKCKYDDINEEYGVVLNKFGLSEEPNGRASVNIDSLEELISLHTEIDKYIKENETEFYFPYFGLMICSDNEHTYLEIKDNYD